ncbi:hypothetical protein ABZ540_31485 [Nocardia xishanensis]|uniref:hypothetical protein n=1 Tax=Nocardia xishanensis TaxID=238964 RepID=UPI0033F327B0
MGTSVGRIKKAIAQLPVPDPWDCRRFVEDVAELRGRPIILLPVGNLGGLASPCGLWLVREHDDVIIYEDSTSEYHMDQIVCHEIGHMVLGHDRAPSSDTGLASDPMFRSVFPDIDPLTVRAVLGRSDYGNGLEREAEMFATMVMVAGGHGQRGQNFRNVLFKQR